MILTKIEIKGFKSFADRTKFEIGTGITCFAGPNGCGKSNLVDALRWALGEQKVSSLRGESMVDVVFKGNATRPAAPYAEVTLVFQNDRGTDEPKPILTAMRSRVEKALDGKNGDSTPTSPQEAHPIRNLPIEKEESDQAELDETSSESSEPHAQSNGEAKNGHGPWSVSNDPQEQSSVQTDESNGTQTVVDLQNRVAAHLDERQMPEVVRVALEYPEVAVTRRLHRSGESEYLLNGTQCRLKDVRDVFVDTGIGVSAYSFMAQGRIDAILSANPAERRALFEEAAGVSRYRQRRKEALRKLERVEQDLLRAGDVIAELERQSRSLKNQAGRAKNYKTYTDRLSEIGRDFSLHSYMHLQENHRRILEKKELAMQLENDCRQRLAECQGKIREAETEASSSAESAANLRTEVAELGARLQAAEARLEDLSERRLELEERLDHQEARRIDLIKTIAEKEKLGESLERDTEAMNENLSGVIGHLAEAREQENVAATRIDKLSEEQASWERSRRSLESKKETTRTESVDLKTSDNSLLGARRQQIIRHNDIAESISKVHTEGRVIRKIGIDLETQKESIQGEHTQCQSRLNAIDEHMGHLGSRIDALKADRVAKASRHEALEGWIENLEGVDEGVKVLLSAAEEGEAGCPRIRGLIAHYVGASMDHARALESALGPLAQAVVVDDVADAIQALAYLKARKVGRVTIVPLSRYLDVTRPRGQDGDRLLNYVQFSPELWPLFEALLGDVNFVESTESFARPIDGTKLVTRDGDLRDRDGTIVGGGSAGAAGLIRRRSELEALEGVIRELNSQIEELETRAAKASGERTIIVQDRERLENQLATLRDEFEAAQRRSRSIRDRLSVFRQDLVIGLNNVHRGDLERVFRLDRLRFLQNAMAEIEEEDAALLGSLESTAEARQVASDQRDEWIEKRRNLDVERTRFDERLRALKDQHRSNVSALNASQSDLEVMEEQVHDVKRRLGDVDTERIETETSTEELGQTRVERQAALSEAFTNSESARQILETIRDEESVKRKHLEEASESMRSVLIQDERQQLNIDRLRERVSEDFDFDLDESMMGYEDDPEKDWPEMEVEIKDLRGKIARLGPVNVDAIEELESVDERLNFMTSERDDLNHARRSLMAMVAEMDAKSRTLFAETFKEVRDNFKEIFRRLFTGGQADIFLNESDGTGEAGVDIIAAPPGKRAQNITLLSGGERTMTAVALLFSLFKAKPSPICVLDEVDAALDDANIERFCRILDDFEKESQFLIVTHAKRTMSRGQVLYGITMERNGVSKPIAVRLGEYAQQN